MALASAARERAERETGGNTGKRWREAEVTCDLEAQPTRGVQVDCGSRVTVQSLGNADLARVMSFLDVRSVARVRSVCKRWDGVLATGAAVLEIVDLAPYNKVMTDEVVAPILQLAGARTRTLRLHNCFHLTDKTFRLIGEMCTGVVELDLSSCWEITDKGLAVIAQGCLDLRRVDLSNCRKISDVGIQALVSASSLPSCSSPLPSDPVAVSQRGITHLTLSYCKLLTDSTMSALATHCAATLVHLNLQRCTAITDEGFAKWHSSETYSFRGLRSLNLADCTFLTDACITHIALAAPNVESLVLSFCCALTDAAIEAVARGFPHLRELDMSFCGAAVSDASIEELVGNVGSTLERLSVRGCIRMSDVGVASVVKECGGLNFLNVSQCKGVSRGRWEGVMRLNIVV